MPSPRSRKDAKGKVETLCRTTLPEADAGASCRHDAGPVFRRRGAWGAGAILAVKLKYIEGWNASRRVVAERYTELFTKAGLADSGVYPGHGVILPHEVSGSRHVWHQYVIRVSRRDELRLVDVGLAAFVCVTSIEALTHTAVLYRSDMLDDETVGTLVDEATRLVVGYLQVGAFRAVSPRIPDRKKRRAADGE